MWCALYDKMSAKRERRRSSRTAPTSLEIRERWPLHWLVWEGKDAELEAVLKEGEVSISSLHRLAVASHFFSEWRTMVTGVRNNAFGSYVDAVKPTARLHKPISQIVHVRGRKYYIPNRDALANPLISH